MRKFALLAALGPALAGCATTATMTAEEGMSAIHVPVVSSTQFVFDAAAPGGMLAPTEAARLDGWFSGLGLDYGDSIYVAGDYSPAARSEVAQIAGRYGLLIANGVPVASAGAPQPGSVRVIVDRKRAFVPGCPDWDRPSSPNYSNSNLPNFGCGVNTNLAAQVANPQDLIHGRVGGAAEDAETAAKAIMMYRSWPHTGMLEGQKKRPLRRVEDVTREDL